MKVLVLGYYYRANLGDEMFAWVWDRLLRQLAEKVFIDPLMPLEYRIKNPDDLNQISADDTDLIILGSGDLINDYFINRLKKLQEAGGYKGPVYAMGVGLPYPQMIEQGALDSFDYVTHRVAQDQQRLAHQLGAHRVQYIPDLAFLLPELTKVEDITPVTLQHNPTYRQINHVNEVGMGKRRKIGVFLARPIYNPKYPEVYEEMIQEMADLLIKMSAVRQPPTLKQRLAKTFKKCSSCSCITDNNQSEEQSLSLTAATDFLYDIYLIPSCCHQASHTKEDDRLINQDLVNRIRAQQSASGGLPANIHLVNTSPSILEILPIFELLDMAVCTRFHAHIFSIMKHVPVLSVYCSRKVHKLIELVGLQKYAYEMPVDPVKLCPVRINADVLWKKFQLLTDPANNSYNYSQVQKKMSAFTQQATAQISEFPTILTNLIFNPVRSACPPHPSIIQEKITKTAKALVKYLGCNDNDTADNNLITQLSQGQMTVNSLVEQHTSERHRSFHSKTITGLLAEQLAEVISFILTGDRKSVYHYGLSEQVLQPDYDLIQSVTWIVTEECHKNKSNPSQTTPLLLKNPVPLVHRRLNLHYLDQHRLSGYHRSGWEYVVQHLEWLHTPGAGASQVPVIFDSFLDRTFGWDYRFLAKLGRIPFKQDWVGFFHHTPNQEYSQNNLVQVFTRSLFQKSLKHCKGILVLSKYLQEWAQTSLKNLGYPDIPVLALTHPTELTPEIFDWVKFMTNHDKSVIQIGAWLRNTYAIYQLPECKYLQKKALIGPQMENYYPKEEYSHQIKQALYQIGSEEEMLSGVSREATTTTCNKYIVGLNQMIEQQASSVQVLTQLNNYEYDQLLSQNVVLINLVDASAVNTVIECLVRGTPILVNRLPAVEEYLGVDYPLYYENFEEAQAKLNDLKLLWKGHRYLARRGISRFLINTFLKQLIESPLYQSL